MRPFGNGNGTGVKSLTLAQGWHWTIGMLKALELAEGSEVSSPVTSA
jgi:hypothetical protein